MRTYVMAALLLGAGGLPASAAPGDECPTARFEDKTDKVKVSTTFSLLSRLVSSLSISPEIERQTKVHVPQTDEYYLKVVMFAVACRRIVSDTTTTPERKLEQIRQWYATSFLLPSALPLPAPQPLPPVLQVPSPAQAAQPVVTPAAARAIANPPANPPSSNATILRVFLKRNLRESDVVALQSVLPQYDVRIGKSNIDPSNAADVLFVNRDKVAVESVIAIMTTLRSYGVLIRSVQQSPLGGRKEIQVGTILDGSSKLPMFANMAPLEISQLSELRGAAFWRAGFNGYVGCNDEIGFLHECAMSPDGRPVPN